MEKQYDNTNRGVLFKNDPQGNPKRPQYRGSLNVGGEEYNLSAWIKESKKTGDKFLSLSVEAKKDSPVRNKAPVEQDEFNDNIPF
jgi:hypothetical protein